MLSQEDLLTPSLMGNELDFWLDGLVRWQVILLIITLVRLITL
ncbi:hypothetical protein MSP8887_01218 [Marinomonas spartinae]|uniref:Uncharacterized protein n=1 Tax=Marinomonas spartinae TaxID=1792290 RepID=A0A1A8T8J6_9GAMM|nr:hypothetical protein MSP8886_00905 [Marinomonas spartinae]SBS30039.1 hypothetical protein MSP8887_01218 [Marinomonas spartinae]